MKFKDIKIGQTFCVSHLPDPAKSIGGILYDKVMPGRWYNALALSNPKYKMRFDDNENVSLYPPNKADQADGVDSSVQS